MSIIPHNNDDAQETPLDAALHYARLGYRVFPCAGGAKNPITRHGLHDATTDAGQIQRWWTSHPHANIGICTDGLIVIDIDEKPGKPANPWPPDPPHRADLATAPTAVTPRTGRHHYFRQPPGREWRNTTGKLAQSVDTRGNGGYVVVAPSLTADGTYRWVRPLPQRNDLPEPPDWLAALLDALDGRADHAVAGARSATSAMRPVERYVQAALDREAGRVAIAKEGSRNDTLNRAAHILGGYVGAGAIERPTVEAALTDAAQRCGLTDQEIATTLRSGLEAGMAAPLAPKETIQVGGLYFVVASARRTPTKLIAEIEIGSTTGPIDRLTLTSALGNRKLFSQSVRRMTNEQIDAEALAGKLLCQAEMHVQSHLQVDGPTIRQIVMEKVPEVFRLAYRTERGAWSEARGCEVARAEFIGFTPGWLIENCKAAAEFSECSPDEIAVLRAVEAALKITWATLIADLPRIESANIQRDSEAATQFRSAIIKLWSRPFAGESLVRQNGEQVNFRASLRSRVASQLQRQSGNTRWAQVHPAYSAWWRQQRAEDGELRIYLAMRYELAAQGQVEISGGDSQASLVETGTKLGAIDPTPPVPTHLSTGKAPLAVLSRELTDYLLAEPIEGDSGASASPTGS